VFGVHRPANYSTKHGETVLAYLASVKDTFVTAAQIISHLQNENISISRPTVYRQLGKMVNGGMVRKYVFGGTSEASFRYVDRDAYDNGLYHLKCEACDGVFNLECDEVGHVSRHILEDHAFEVNESKTVFYGKCGTCRQSGNLMNRR
jgi:Fur family ferric uptake transcriptional regulator